MDLSAEQRARLRWATAPQLAEAAARRRELLDALRGRVELGFKGTKLDCRGRSPGCRICGEGRWSCLFINGRCNCRCFYCPAPQDDDAPPTTNQVAFARPGDYADYVARMGFTGVSISGGEPLLALDRSLAFIREVKRRLGERLHVWLYTNGLLAGEAQLRALRQAGLDEIRIDIGAVAHDLQAAQRAAGIVPCVTVEIPAVPGEEALLRRLLPRMAELGVAHLNLHQLRLTPHNLPHLEARGYSFVEGDDVVVLQSELAALELIRFGQEQGLPLPINYCSSAYKRRFQRAAARSLSARHVIKGYEEITESGHIRTLWLAGDPAANARRAAALAAAGAAAGTYQLTPDHERLYLTPRQLAGVDLEGAGAFVSYAEPGIRPRMSYRNAFCELRLNRKLTIVVEREVRASGIALSAAEVPLLLAAALAPQDPLPAHDAGGELGRALALERIADGLPPLG